MKPLFWVGTSKKDLLGMPAEVVVVVGYALYMAQSGKKHFAGQAPQRLRIGRSARGCGRPRRQHITRGLYRQVQQRRVCAALLPEKIAQGD